MFVLRQHIDSIATLATIVTFDTSALTLNLPTPLSPPPCTAILKAPVAKGSVSVAAPIPSGGGGGGELGTDDGVVSVSVLGATQRIKRYM